MKIGDRVLAINGINVSGASLQEAHSVMRQCRGTTLFLIEYDVAIVGKIDESTSTSIRFRLSLIDGGIKSSMGFKLVYHHDREIARRGE